MLACKIIFSPGSGGTHLNSSTQEAEAGEFEGSLVLYRVSSRAAGSTQRTPVLKTKGGIKIIVLFNSVLSLYQMHFYVV